MDFLQVLVVALVLQINVSNAMHNRDRRATLCRRKLDLAFVIDSSVSIPPEDFKKQMKFVQDVVKFLDVGKDKTLVAAVSFSNHLFPEFGFNDFTTKDEVLEALGQIKHSQGDATRTYLALNHTHTNIYASGNGERSDADDVVVVLTDGETNPGRYDPGFWKEKAKQQTQIEAKAIKDRPAYVFAIGVGSAVDVKELNGISSDPDTTFTIQVESFAELNTDKFEKMLASRACKPEPKEEECKEAVADIFFVLDESSSIKWQSNFDKELKFVVDVVDYLEIGPTKTQVGVMTFSDDPKMEFNLTAYTTRTDIANAIQQIKWDGGNTFLDEALEMLREKGLYPANGARHDVPQIAVIITDGVSTDPTKTRNELKKLHDQNYLLFAIGVGPEKDIAELQTIANNPDNVFAVDSVEALTEIRKSLASRLCVETVSRMEPKKKP